MVQSDAIPERVYPDSDGKPMADNTKQFNWVVKLKENLELIYINNPSVFVAGDLLWYPVQGSLKRTAPDTMVVFGRPKGDRGSYKQWEEANVPPQVVFEILSPGNIREEMADKFRFYEQYGVEEYYLYDPDTNQIDGWLRQREKLEPIFIIQNWVSPRLGIRFVLFAEELEIYRPDGVKFLTLAELEAQAKQAADLLIQERQRTERLAAKLRELGINPDEL